MQRIESHASFGGRQEVWEHDSQVLGVPMRFAIYLPPAASQGPRPVLWFLSGLTCTEQNVVTKGGFQQHCAEHGLVFVCPDTSPRGEGVPNDEAYDLGQGAGFYLDATESPWAEHFRMETYLTQELPALVAEHFPVTQVQGITGHSMGGHGALVLALRHPGRFRTVSAFAPIVAPCDVPWGQKAFRAYLGRDASPEHDATRLIADRGPLPGAPTILIDQGTADGFLAEQLQPERFATACEAAGQPLTLRLQDGYDHSYYFISSFAGDHVAHHAAGLVG